MTSATLIVTRSDLPELGELRGWEGERLTFSRVEHDGVVDLATNDVRLVPGDLCTVIGDPDVVDRFVDWAGHRSERHLALDRRKLDFRRISVSRRELAGARLREVDLEGRFGAMATRVRRGDADLVVDRDFVLRLGDRVRVVGPAEKMGDIAEALGDSDRGLSEVDPLGFATGLAIGLVLAQVAIPLPGGGEIELGVGGGPLIAALVLGTVSADRAVHMADSPRGQPHDPPARGPALPRRRGAAFRARPSRTRSAPASGCSWPSPECSSPSPRRR